MHDLPFICTLKANLGLGWEDCQHAVNDEFLILSSQVVSLPCKSVIHGGCKLLCSNGHLDRSRCEFLCMVTGCALGKDVCL